MIGKNRMEIDWTYVKRTSLWHYDELIQKIQSVMEYRFVIQYYNHSIKDAISYSEKLQQRVYPKWEKTISNKGHNRDVYTTIQKRCKRLQGIIAKCSRQN